jgi:Domain of unknown function (DUF4157)
MASSPTKTRKTVRRKASAALIPGRHKPGATPRKKGMIPGQTFSAESFQQSRKFNPAVFYNDPTIVNGVKTSSLESGQSASVERILESRAGKGNALSVETRAIMEPVLGKRFDNVRVHHDAEAAQISKQVNANALTYGKDIFFDTGKFDPKSREGKKLLAHELTHVLQQEEHAMKMLQKDDKGKTGAEEKKGATSEMKDGTPCDSWWPFSSALFDGGRVEFQGFSKSDFSNVALMPENPLADGTCPTSTPTLNDHWYGDIDGVWFRGNSLWLKIPDHCAAIVYKSGSSFEVCYWCIETASWFKGRARWSSDGHCAPNPFK